MANIKDKVVTVESLSALHDHTVKSLLDLKDDLQEHNEATYVKRSGDTVSGKLYVGNVSGVKTDADWAGFCFYGTDEKIRGDIMVNSDNQMHFDNRIHYKNDDGTYNGESYADRYYLPKLPDFDSGLTGDNWHAIITTKNTDDFFKYGNTILSSYQYGNALPAAGNKGRVFFKKLSG